MSISFNWFLFSNSTNYVSANFYKLNCLSSMNTFRKLMTKLRYVNATPLSIQQHFLCVWDRFIVVSRLFGSKVDRVYVVGGWELSYQKLYYHAKVLLEHFNLMSAWKVELDVRFPFFLVFFFISNLIPFIYIALKLNHEKNSIQCIHNQLNLEMLPFRHDGLLRHWFKFIKCALQISWVLHI